MRLTSFDHDGLTFDVRDTGPEGGDPVVLLHGFPERATSWSHVEPLLHEAGLQTYALDQRGYSPGARPRFRWSYRPTALVGDVLALVERIGRPVHLVGHDWGAAVAWGVAGHHPEAVRSLTAVSVPHPAAVVGAAFHGQALASAYFLPFNVPGLVEHLPGTLERWMRRIGADDETVGRTQHEVVEDGALAGGLGWYRAMLLAPPGYARARVGVPTTYVWSTRDPALTRAAAERCGDWVDAAYELVVLDGVTHWIPTQAPRPLAEAVLARIASVA